MSNYAQITRRKLLLCLLPASGACLSTPLASESLQPHLSSGQIHVIAPRLHFVTGKTLERLQNGSPVPLAIQLTLSTDRWMTIRQRDIERFVLSYDLWEERFAISKLGSPRKSVSHLSAPAAETWCIGEMMLPPEGVASEQPFWLRLEVRPEAPGEDSRILTEEGVSLTKLVELFSRRTRSEQTRWSVDAGPFRLAELSRPPRPGGGR